MDEWEKLESEVETLCDRPAQFQKKLRRMAETMTDLEIAETFDMSVPTVRRWLDGASIPTPWIQKFILNHPGNFPT